VPKTESQSAYLFGQFRLVPEKRRLLDADHQSIPMRGKVFDLLWYLIQHKGRLVGKTELLEALWPDSVVEENNLNQAISALRQALGDDVKAPDYIATIKGRGYQFIGDVQVDSTCAEDSSDTMPGALPDQAHSGRLRFWPALVSIAVLAVATLLWLSRDQEIPLPATSVVERFADARISLATDYAGSHSAPTLSPDGRMMAYISDVSGTPQVWIKNLQRGDPIQITDGPFAAHSPTWSPNDDQILFARNGPNGSAIYSVGTLGSPKATVVVERGWAPSYSKRDNAFVFSRGREIWIARNDGRDIEKIVGVPSDQGFAQREPALSPDGKLVAFIHANEGPLGTLWVIPSEGGEARQLTTLEEYSGNVGDPEWSADGEYIVYTVEPNDGGGHLWRVDVDSGEVEALTTGARGASDADISSAGNRLAYTATRSVWRLTRVDPLTAETTDIHTSRTPVLLPVASPDGERIVFFTRKATGMQLMMIDNDGSNLRQLTFDEPGGNALPTWAGDGESIFYYRDRALHRLNPKDGSDTQIFADFHWSSRNWLNAHGNRVTYHKIDRPNRRQETVVREIGEGTESKLPVPIEGAQWSDDGRELLGWHRQTGELLVCNVEEATCSNISNGGENIRGVYPMWSNDGQQIYYLLGTDKASCCALWRIDRDGSNKKYAAELAGFQGDNSYYGVDSNGDIFYNHLDRGTDEIWIAEVNE